MSEQPENEKIEEETNGVKTAEPKLKRRWFQYSIRSLMLVTLLIACWLGYISHNARKQKAAVAWVKSMEGNLWYDYQMEEDGMWKANPEPPGPDWLREWIGIDYFSDVYWVDLANTQVTDLSPLEYLPNLEVLNLSFTQVTDLSSLDGMSNLFFLQMVDTPVSKKEVHKVHLALPNCVKRWDGGWLPPEARPDDYDQ